MKDPATNPERRYNYNLRDEKMTIDEFDGQFHVTLAHRSGPKVEGSGSNLDELVETLREELEGKVGTGN